jgi:NAD(P)-dependent dehydrogenase (short-subunit alcohol dehydrogenase family)
MEQQAQIKKEEDRIQGKVVVITGATSGIGAVAAERLASMGARILAIARDRARGEATLARLRELAPGRAHGVYYADLSLLGEVKRVACEIAAAEPRIDVLINNAGALFDKRQLTSEGMELTFATNHMSYFALVNGFRERLLASAPARVINTSSEAHRRMKIDFGDLQAARGYGAFKAYGRSKLCNILFTRELARQLTGTGVTANCLHPGFVNTRFGDQARGTLYYIFRFAKKFAISPEEGAETIVFLASAKEVAGVTGQYFYQSRPKTPSMEAQDDEAAKRLWQESAKLASIEMLV